MSRKAQGLSINTIVLLILAVLVLVLVIVGFTMGWENLWSLVRGITPTKNNVDFVVNSCSLQCASQQVNEFCNTKKNVKGGESLGIPSAEYTCGQLRNFLRGKTPNLDDCVIECK